MRGWAGLGWAGVGHVWRETELVLWGGVSRCVTQLSGCACKEKPGSVQCETVWEVGTAPGRQAACYVRHRDGWQGCWFASIAGMFGASIANLLFSGL